jgi:hypothetical protein
MFIVFTLINNHSMIKKILNIPQKSSILTEFQVFLKRQASLFFCIPIFLTSITLSLLSTFPTCSRLFLFSLNNNTAHAEEASQQKKHSGKREPKKADLITGKEVKYNECSGVGTQKGKSPVFTNLACKDGKLIVTEKGTATPSPEELLNKKKKALLSSLDFERFRLKKEFGIEIDIAKVKAKCDEGDFLSCETAINEKDKEIRDTYTQQKNLKTAAKQKSNKEILTPSKTIITVIQNNRVTTAPDTGHITREPITQQQQSVHFEKLHPSVVKKDAQEMPLQNSTATVNNLPDNNVSHARGALSAPNVGK